MKAIISTNYDPKYVFFMPIVAWSWGKLGVETRFLAPYMNISFLVKEYKIIEKYIKQLSLNVSMHTFYVPSDNHEVTYTQVSRLFAAADTRIPDDEVLVVGDVDMAIFRLPFLSPNHHFTIEGADLVPPNQYPMCYISATAAAWRKTFIKGRTLQQCLDDTFAGIECENMRGNYWSFDQENAYNLIKPTNPMLINRAKEGTQFASHRVDRDNAYWREDLINGGLGIMDAHLWRPGYTLENTEKIVGLLTIMYPNDSFDWVREYAAEFRKLIK
jgi:hypothetical protein